MLNYIWAGLIVVSLAFALWSDARDLARDPYRNGRPLPVGLAFPDGYEPRAREQAVEIRLDPAAFARHYGDGAVADTASLAGTLATTEDGTELRFDAEAALPAPLPTVRDATNPRDLVLQGETATFAAVPAGTRAVRTAVTFPAVRFVKLTAVSQAALDMAETAAELALGLIGVLALFLGLLKIGEAAGVVAAMGRLVEPLLRPFFPEVPRGHPAFSFIVLNLSANMFGLGNAATPFGLKAMEALQSLNPERTTATNPMVMLLVMNTASVQLVPPILLIALMGLQVNELMVPILLATGLSLVAAVTLAKGFARLPRFRRTDPNRAPVSSEQ